MRTGRTLVLLAALLLPSGLVLAAGAVGGAALAAPRPAAADPAAYPGDSTSEAGIVEDEDRRLVEVRTASSLSAFSDKPFDGPYRLVTGAAYTLVLPARSAAYTTADLLELAPQTFVRRPDGAYLLSENIVVEVGASLELSDPDGLRLLLASDAASFVSIINDGGNLDISGSPSLPATVTSFDRTSEEPDSLTDDGRAYVRSIGGTVALTDVTVDSLGFWSGRTGGLALTGTDRPTSGSLAKQAAGAPVGEPVATGEAVPEIEGAVPQFSYVTAKIDDLTVTHNAYGLFVSGANGLDVRDSSFDDDLVSGVVLHRYVVNAVLAGTSARHNAQDGISLARATTGIVMSDLVVTDNGRNGLTLSGQPLADGPSAAGLPVSSYGNNSVADSTASNNGRYGIEVAGGANIDVTGNEVRGNETGIVVRDGSNEVTVSENNVSDSTTQGIAVRDGVGAVTVARNIVTGGLTSLYVRGSVATVRKNTFTNADTHAVSLVGSVGTTSVTDNVVIGSGTSAIDSRRAPDFDRAGLDNDTTGWRDTTPFVQTLKRFLQPLTLLWSLLAAILLFTAFRGARRRRTKSHPYPERPLLVPDLSLIVTNRDREDVRA